MKLNREYSSLLSVTNEDQTKKWDLRFLKLAKEISTWSKDPSTKLGCVLVRDYDHAVVSMGYNGFPRCIDDDEIKLNDREEKYHRIIHAEQNALLKSTTKDWNVVYTYPLPPCVRCAVSLLEHGHMETMVSMLYWPDRWDASIQRTIKLFKEARIELRLYDE